jgi:hypothetical protein
VLRLFKWLSVLALGLICLGCGGCCALEALISFDPFKYQELDRVVREKLWGLRGTSFEGTTDRAMSQILGVAYDYSPDDLAYWRKWDGHTIGLVDMRDECYHCNRCFVWKIKPPSGEKINPQKYRAQFSDVDREVPFRSIFIACCEESGPDGKRIFFFLPHGWQLLSDDEVSWYWQRRLFDLTPDEVAQEQRLQAGKNSTQAP